MNTCTTLIGLAARYADAQNTSISVTNPADKKEICTVPMVSRETLKIAIDDTARAFEIWRKESAQKRTEVLRAFAQAMRTDTERLSHILTLENGKPLSESKGEIEYAAGFVDWFADEARRIYGQVQRVSNNMSMQVSREPVGVCAAITPWNFPSAMITRKAGAAIAAGCSMIVKPAPETPLSALALMELIEGCGAPQGLLNVVVCDPEIFSDGIMLDRRVRKLTFTGSTAVGKVLASKGGANLKRMTMELGGNAPCIVFEDVDLDKAVDDAIFAKFRNGGQTCIAINRFFVHEKVIEPFTLKLIEKVSRLNVGDGMNSGTAIGPIINMKAVEKIKRLLEDAVSKGAVIRYGMIPDAQDCFVQPVVIDQLHHSMAIFSEEIFGPICALYSFKSEEEVITSANDTPHGLAAYIHTCDLYRAHRVSSALNFGMIGLNETRISSPLSCFGGVKESGFGYEGGSEGIKEYLNNKHITESF